MKRQYSLYLIFFFSGLGGLIYESVWTHYLKLFLGSAAYAQALVLGLFMGGLALGAWLSNRFLHRWKNLLIAYAVVELIIGIAGLLFHDLFVMFQQFSYQVVLPALESPFLIKLYKWAGAGMLIFPQCILLGMTFPLMSNGFIRQFPGQPGGTIAFLYFSNSIGAACGVLLAGFVLIAWSGLPGTILTAACVNIFVALAVWWLVRPFRSQPPPSWQATGSTQVRGGKQYLFRCVCLVAFFTGFASFIYEITWIRMLSLVLGASTHAFELMLSAFILGLALGGLFIAHYVDRISNPLRATAWIQVVMALCAVLTLPMYGYTYTLMEKFMFALDLNDAGYTFYNLLSHFTALLVMLPTTICAGMTLPLLTLSLARHEQYAEKSIGIVYAVNTIGSLLGVYLTIFYLMPVLGLGWALFTGVMIDLLLGLVLFFLLVSTQERRLVVPLATALTVIFVGILYAPLDRKLMTSSIFRHGSSSPAANSVLYYRDGASATVAVGEGEEFHRFIQTNGKSDAGMYVGDDVDAVRADRGDIETMLLLGLLPVLLHPDAKQVANIGFGSGLTTHTLLAASENIQRVDTIEIEPGMYEGARFFMPRNRLAYEDQRSHIHFEDAKIFFSDHKRQYDIIVSEPSNPWSNGTASLFTEEFYAHIKRHLAEDGILVQWLHTYSFSPELLATVINALHGQFSYLHYYRVYDGGDIILIAGDKTLPFLPQQSSILSMPKEELHYLLQTVGIASAEDLWLRFIGDQNIISPWVMDHSTGINSDFYPLLDLGAVRARFLGLSINAFIFFRDAWLPFKDWWYVEKVPLASARSFSPLYNGFSVGIDVDQAHYLLDYVSGEPGLEPLGEYKDGVYAQWDWLQLLQLELQSSPADCTAWQEHRAVNFRTNVRVLLEVAMLRWIPQERNEEFLMLLRDHRCIAKMDLWLDWYEALVAGDMTGIELTAAHMIKYEEELTQDEKQQLLESRLVANIVLHDFQAAIDLMDEYKEEIYGDGDVPIWLQFPMVMALLVTSDEKPSPSSDQEQVSTN